MCGGIRFGQATEVHGAVEFSSDENVEGGEIKPDESGDSSAEGAVEHGVVGDAGDVEAEGESGGEPEKCGSDGAGGDALPGLLVAGAEVIEGGEDGDAGEESDGPANDAPENEHDETQFVVGVEDHPVLDLVAKDDHDGGEGERNERHRDEEHSAKAELPKAPGVAREVICPSEAFHEGEHHT